MSACTSSAIVWSRYGQDKMGNRSCGVGWLLAKHMSAITNLRHEALRDVADADGEPWYSKTRGSIPV